uniref:Eukaryotic translation initiation factor 3 subunit B n=1 Tax=Caenorhabditis japonica TaxID=281687 RepID=A0A8R1E1K4_CAEJA
MVEIDMNKENEEDFSDPPGYVDDITDDALVPDVIHQKPVIEEFEDNCVFITGIPLVGADRLGRLQSVLKKVLEKLDPAVKLYLPPSAEGGTLGVLFTEWSDSKSAQFAVKSLDGYAFDKSHTFTAHLFTEMKKLTAPADDWKTPEKQPYTDVGDLWWWMQHDRCRDQFAILHDKNGVPTVGVFTNMKGNEPELAGDLDKAERANWTETVFTWSPHGSYLSTIHKRGIILWGGPEYARAHRFAHDNVQYIDFSPCETFLVTYAAPEETEKWWDCEKDSLRIWDVRTGELKKSFSTFELTGRTQLPTWPFFKWSFDEKYFACLKAPEKDKLEKEKKIDGISVFEAETFELYQKRAVTIEHIKHFEWAPNATTLAYYSECTDAVPAEFGLLQVPSMQRLRSARVHNVADAQLFWQKCGKRLAFYTMRYNKKAYRDTGDIKYVGGCTYHIDIFEIDKKDVSLMNLPLTEPFIHFDWDPEGDKFCVLVGNTAKATPQVYKIEPNSHAPKLVSKLDPGVHFNEVQFAPKGGWLAILAKVSSGGNVYFIDTSLAEAKRTNVIEHPLFNKGYWDPTGRYFVTCSTLGGRSGADLGYRIYSFQGRELCRKNLDRLAQFKWRPRPPVKLSEQKQKEIKKNLKKIAARFIKQDDDEKCRASQEVIEKRRKIMAAFDVIRNRNLEYLASIREARIELRNGVDTDAEPNEDEFVDEEITIALSTSKTMAPLSEEDERD